MIQLFKRKGRNPNTNEIVYYPQIVNNHPVDAVDIAKKMARSSTYSAGETTGVLQDFFEYVYDELLVGNPVCIPGLGTFKPKASGESSPDAHDVTIRNIKLSVIYEPDPSLESRLNTEAEFEFGEYKKLH